MDDPMLTPGTRVRVLTHRIPGHCRTPFYLKGHEGVVVAITGAFRNPELLAYHRPGLPAKRLYRIRFRQQDLWPQYDGSKSDTVEADLYEHWLEPLTQGAAA
jgi:hypothetical protein